MKLLEWLRTMFRSSGKPSKYMRKITWARQDRHSWEWRAGAWPFGDCAVLSPACAKTKGIVDMIHCLAGRSCFKLSLTLTSDVLASCKSNCEMLPLAFCPACSVIEINRNHSKLPQPKILQLEGMPRLPCQHPGYFHHLWQSGLTRNPVKKNGVGGRWDQETGTASLHSTQCFRMSCCQMQEHHINNTE